MQLFYSTSIEDTTITLNNDEFRHCIKVLRHKVGDTLNITNGKGDLYSATINSIAKHHCTALIESVTHFKPATQQLHIAIAPTKNTDRTEWAIEKLVEIGVHKISLIHCEHSERKTQKTERLKKRTLAAMKQSLKYHLPQIDELVTFNNFIQSVSAKKQNLFIGYCENEETTYLPKQAFTQNATLVLIGPEGDFSPYEIETAKQVGFKPISLGKSRLRTETAAIVAATLINSKFEVENT